MRARVIKYLRKVFKWLFLNILCLEAAEFISTEGALRLPTTYDDHPIPSHPSTKPL